LIAPGRIGGLLKDNPEAIADSINLCRKKIVNGHELVLIWIKHYSYYKV
jgi:hypothetical protein